MESEYYHCNYCQKEYTPTRRRVQQYCTNSCRSKAHHAKNTQTKSLSIKEKEVQLPSKMKIEKMSFAGVANSAAGTLSADALKAVFTPYNDKPATKGDLKKLVSEINGRYHIIKNLPARFDGALPYFDFDTNEIVYISPN